ncbi:hypothetical protein [Duganella caerulea]|uniref:hypothetical protein n=1 Tax=Duganella caerulea TaxID=2885762 RepID=UPI0040376C10
MKRSFHVTVATVRHGQPVTATASISKRNPGSSRASRAYHCAVDAMVRRSPASGWWPCITCRCEAANCGSTRS